MAFGGGGFQPRGGRIQLLLERLAPGNLFGQVGAIIPHEITRLVLNFDPSCFKWRLSHLTHPLFAVLARNKAPEAPPDY